MPSGLTHHNDIGNPSMCRPGLAPCVPGMVRNDSGNGTELFREWYGTIPGMVRNDSRTGAVWYMDEAGLMRQKGY